MKRVESSCGGRAVEGPKSRMARLCKIPLCARYALCGSRPKDQKKRLLLRRFFAGALCRRAGVARFPLTAPRAALSNRARSRASGEARAFTPSFLSSPQPHFASSVSAGIIPVSPRSPPDSCPAARASITIRVTSARANCVAALTSSSQRHPATAVKKIYS